MFSTRNEGKPVVVERFIRPFKNKTYKHTSSISKNVSTDKWDDIVDKYNNTYHKAIKTKPIDVTLSTYFDFEVENNDKDQVINVSSGKFMKINLKAG